MRKLKKNNNLFNQIFSIFVTEKYENIFYLCITNKYNKYDNQMIKDYT